jgi:DNA (cytosine-5)-methyltransferase 1
MMTTRGSGSGKTFCEFFAGIGLVRAGLERSGWSCSYANDIDAKKEEMYRARFPGSGHFHLEDVCHSTPHFSLSPALAVIHLSCHAVGRTNTWRQT